MSTPFQSAFEVSISHAFSASRSSTQAFGQSSSAFAPNTSAFFSRFGTSTPAFSSSALGSSLSTSPPSIFGPSTSYPFCTCCHFHNTPCGQTCRFRNTLRGQTATLSQSSLFCSPSCGIFGGSQTPAPAFGNAGIMQSGFGGQEGGSIVASYSTTSINPFISTIPNSNRFAPKTSTFFPGFGTSAPSFSSSAFVSSLSAAAPSIFGPSTSYLVCSCGRVHNTPCGQTADLSQSSLFSSPPCGLVGGSQTPAPAFGNTGIGWSGFGETLEKLEAISARLQTLFSQPCGQTAALSESTPKLASISTMVVYKDQSHEEQRWEDYQLGNKGSPIPTSVFGLVLGSQDLEINRVEVE